jgi:hypothetical protein
MGRRAVLFLCLFVMACASARTGGGSALYRREVGNATPSDAMRIGLRIVQQFQYEVFQIDTITELNILTHWKPRRPFADELALGVTSAESRMNIIGRLRGQNDVCRAYNLYLTLENRVRVAGSADWNESTNTPLFTQNGDEIVAEFRRRLADIGVRRC